MIENLLNGRKDEGLWIRPETKDVRIETPIPHNLERDVRIPESVAYARFIQLDCLKRLKKGTK